MSRCTENGSARTALQDPAPIDEALFRLLRAGLHPDREPEPLPALDETRWEALFRLCVRQGVTGIAWEGFQRCQAAGAIASGAAPPRALKLRWALQAEQTRRRYGQQRRILRDLASFYDSHGIRMMVLKGYGLSRYYPRPEERPCGDIDIWLFGRQAEGDRLLRSERQIAVGEDVHHHTTFEIDGVPIENHFDFLNVYAHPSNREIERILRQLSAQPEERTEIDGVRVYLPSPDFNALFLLRHAASHFAAQEIGMRHVTDWALFVRRESASIDWQALNRIARRMNMHRFLNCLNAISIDCLGMDAALFAPFERDPALERRVLGDILRPEFADEAPRKGLVRSLRFKYRRWWANRWKHRIVYNESLAWTFLVQLRSHLMKPRTLLR